MLAILAAGSSLATLALSPAYAADGVPSGAAAPPAATVKPTKVAEPAEAAAAPGAAPLGAPVTVLTHRPLRANQPPPAEPTPTPPETFAGYPDAPAFTVVPRKAELALFPCSQCHKLLPLNTQPRLLVNAPHNAALVHGNGRMWCLDCHQGNDRDVLHTVSGTKVDFDQSYLVCGVCHSARQRDWYYGAHGKRVANWKGAREIYSCTHCHDPHSPSLKPRAPSKPPPVRAGLSPMIREPVIDLMPWQRAPQGARDGKADRP
jgi:hypothetical protein